MAYGKSASSENSNMGRTKQGELTGKATDRAVASHDEINAKRHSVRMDIWNENGFLVLRGGPAFDMSNGTMLVESSFCLELFGSIEPITAKDC